MSLLNLGRVEEAAAKLRQAADSGQLRAHGFHVRFFAVTREVAARLVRHHVAFVICWEADEAGHAVAVVGIDERAGTLLVHDPAMFRTGECLFDALDSNAGPLGITGMAVVAADRAALLGRPPPARIRHRPRCCSGRRGRRSRCRKEACCSACPATRRIAAAASCRGMYPTFPRVGPQRYQTMTREMEGHTGPLFAHFVVPINLALLFAVAAIIALAATGR